MARELIATPAAPCRWAKVLEPAGYKPFSDGDPFEWSIELVLDPKNDKDHAAFMIQAEELYAQHHGETRKNAYWLPLREGEGDDAGKMICRFKTKLRVFKDGKTTQPPTVEDTEKKPWPQEKLIGNGSIVRVAFEVYAWKAPSGAGLTFQPKIIQVREWLPAPAGVGGASRGDVFGDSRFD